MYPPKRTEKDRETDKRQLLQRVNLPSAANDGASPPTLEKLQKTTTKSKE